MAEARRKEAKRRELDTPALAPIRPTNRSRGFRGAQGRSKRAQAFKLNLWPSYPGHMHDIRRLVFAGFWGLGWGRRSSGCAASEGLAGGMFGRVGLGETLQGFDAASDEQRKQRLCPILISNLNKGSAKDLWWVQVIPVAECPPLFYSQRYPISANEKRESSIFAHASLSGPPLARFETGE